MPELALFGAPSTMTKHLRSIARAFTPVVALSLTLPLLPACSALPKAGDALGEDHTKRDKGICQDRGGQSRFLVVDWESVDRAEIEARAQRGLVVVHYQDCKMEVLKRCSVKNAPQYDYVGLTPKKDAVTMRDSAEVYANIPISAAKFDAKLAHSGSLDVNMTIVGQFDTARPIAAENELEGDCAGATHIVSAITVGAFEFAATNGNDASAGVTVLGAGAGAKGNQNKEVLNRDGSESECGGATGSDKKPPFGCGAPLRVEVVPLGHARSAEPSCPSHTQWDGRQCLAVKTDTNCPAGMIADRTQGCIAKKQEVAPTYASAGSFVAPVSSDCSDEGTCKERCDKNDPKGCLGLGGALRQRLSTRASSDGERARVAFQKACDGGEATACTALGEMKFQGLGISRDPEGSFAHFEKACAGNDPAGCNDMGLALTQSSSPDTTKAKGYFEKACDARSSLGCLGLGMLYRDGRGVNKDPSKAKELFKKACDAKIAPACKL